MMKVIGMMRERVTCCKHCGCKFSYEDEDIKDAVLDGYVYTRDVGYVECPMCFEKDCCKRSNKRRIVLRNVIDIPDTESGLHDNFQHFFKKLKLETERHIITNTNIVCGPDDLTTIEMFLEAFKKSEIVESVTDFSDRCRECGKTTKTGLSISEIKKILDECKAKKEMDVSDNDVKSMLLISHIYSSIFRALVEYEKERL